jgi:Xaa-Pro dipeptidase
MNMILMDSNNVLAMNLGETYLVTENGNERLGKQKLDLVFLWAAVPSLTKFQ